MRRFVAATVVTGALALGAGSAADATPVQAAPAVSRSSIVCANSWFCAYWWSFPGGLSWVFRNAS